MGRVRWHPPKTRLLHGLEAVLPPLHRLVGREAVLDEVQSAARLQDAAQLAQRRVEVGDRAHRPGRQRRVERVVAERQRRAVEARALDRDGARVESLAGELPADVGRFDRGDAGDRRGVVGHVQPGPEPDLDDLAGEPVAHAPALRLRGLRRAQGIGHAGEHLIAVQAHGRAYAGVETPSPKRTPVSSSETSHSRRATSASSAASLRPTSFGAPRCSMNPPGPAKAAGGTSATAA